jgi:hypothetical protein
VTTVGSIVSDATRKMYGSMAETLNLLGAAYVAGSGRLRLRYANRNIIPGTVLSCGLNTWYVLEGDPTGEEIIVLPSFDGGPDEDMPEGSTVMVRPKVTIFQAFSEVSDENVSLSSPVNGLFAIKKWSSVVDTTWGTYPVDPTVGVIHRVLSVRYLRPGSVDEWVEVPNGSFDFQPDGSGGQVVKVTGLIPGGTTVEFSGAGPFLRPTGLDQDIADIFHPEHLGDIPALGAAAAMLLTQESRRLQPLAQGDPRRAEEVPATSNSSAAREMRRAQKARIDEEYARMVRLWPWQVPMPREKVR